MPPNEIDHLILHLILLLLNLMFGTNVSNDVTTRMSHFNSWTVKNAKSQVANALYWTGHSKTALLTDLLLQMQFGSGRFLKTIHTFEATYRLQTSDFDSAPLKHY